jgi:hypothetical protein
MKVEGQRGFWPLRPTLTAGRLEFVCWLAAGLLAVALASSPTPPVRSPAKAVAAVAAAQAPDLLIFRRHCIDRILASDLGDTEEYIARKINQQCTISRRTTARRVRLTCDRPFVVPFTPVARRLTSCVSGQPKQISIAAEMVSTR